MCEHCPVCDLKAAQGFCLSRCDAIYTGSCPAELNELGNISRFFIPKPRKKTQVLWKETLSFSFFLSFFLSFLLSFFLFYSVGCLRKNYSEIIIRSLSLSPFADSLIHSDVVQVLSFANLREITYESVHVLPNTLLPLKAVSVTQTSFSSLLSI